MGKTPVPPPLQPLPPSPAGERVGALCGAERPAAGGAGCDQHVVRPAAAAHSAGAGAAAGRDAAAHAAAESGGSHLGLCATHWHRPNQMQCTRYGDSRLAASEVQSVGSPLPGGISQEAALGGLAASHPRQVPLQQAIQLHGAWLPAAAHPAQPAGGAGVHSGMSGAAAVTWSPSDVSIPGTPGS